MNHASSLSAKIGALVHESALADPVALALHKAIIATRLLTTLAVLIAAPICVSLFGPPEPWQVACFAWLMTPLFSVALLSRTGRLPEAQTLAALCFIGLALTLGLRGGALSGAAFAWLLLAVVEAAFTLNRTLVGLIGGTAAAAGLFLVSASGGAASPSSGLGLMLADFPAIAYAVLAALWGLRLVAQRERMERIGAARFDSLSDALGDLVMHHDRSGAVLFASREAQSLFGLTARDLVGRGFFERVNVADRPAFLTAILDAADSDRTATATLRLRVSSSAEYGERQADPAYAWVELRARRLTASIDQGEACIVSVVRDVTALKRHERQLEEARFEAEQTMAWKDRFLANISHELRTPLNGIIGFSEMLCSEELAPKDPAKQREYAEIIRSSGQHLLSVVNSILDMSKIEAGRFDILPEPFDIAPLIDSCCDMVRLKAEQGSVELIKSCPTSLPELVADKRACRQILINLLSNALKFTAAGGRVTIGARAEGNSIALYVADTGIGIGAPDLPHIGDAFFQARSAYDRPYEGTGLGLSVVRGLVGLHGGAIVLESAPGEGTCVTIRMPRDGRQARASQGAPAKIEVIARTSDRAYDSPPPVLTVVKKIA